MALAKLANIMRIRSWPFRLPWTVGLFKKKIAYHIDSIVHRTKRKWFTALCWSRAKLTEASLYLDHPSFERGHKNQHGLFKVDKVVVTPWNMT